MSLCWESIGCAAINCQQLKMEFFTFKDKILSYLRFHGSFNNVLFLIPATSNHQLKIDLDPVGSILSRSLAAAKKFGVKCEEGIEPCKFIVAYLTKLLLQREKLDLGVLDSYIPREVKEAWKEFLSCLEQTKRRLLGITEGSLNFTLFCPTTESREQLQDGIWRRLLTEKLKHLITVIGI